MVRIYESMQHTYAEALHPAGIRRRKGHDDSGERACADVHPTRHPCPDVVAEGPSKSSETASMLEPRATPEKE